jgi:serine/threonine protein kinase
MSDPKCAPGADPTEMQSSGQLDPTLARPDGTFVLPSDRARLESEPNFAPPEKPGEVGKLGRYRVLKKIGRGGMGAVYLAFDTVLSRRIALKVMLTHHVADAESRERFLREARAAAMVKSDHIVTIFDVDEIRGVPFIAMEYLLGYPLDQYLRVTGELPLAQVLRVGRETALGLVAAHDLGLVHRDIKPGNIWLEAPHGRVKLLDFGLARAQNDDTQLTTSGIVVGTPAFMSPEQARGHKLDGRSDLFSLGVMLYRVATGKMPFDGPTTMAILTALAVDTPTSVRKLNANVPEELEAIINKLLAKAPADRYRTAWEVVEALRAAEAPRPVAGVLPTVVEAVPMAIIVQSENVWVGIEESGSRPRVLEDETDEAPDSVAVASSRWKKVERKPSVVPAILAGVALLAAVVLAVFAVVFLWPKNEKEKEPVVQNPGNENRPPSKPPAPKPVPASDPDRRAAEYILSAGGAVQVNGEGKDIKTTDKLPGERFALTRVEVHGKHVTTEALGVFAGCKNLTYLDLNNTAVTDEGLAHFKDCKNLKHIDLCLTPVSDAGLAIFKDYRDVERLGLAETSIGNVGLVNFKNCKNLVYLNLQRTQVSDDGLEPLNDCKRLSYLRVLETKVTPEFIKEFAKAHPQCTIVHDGGTIDPKK